MSSRGREEEIKIKARGERRERKEKSQLERWRDSLWWSGLPGGVYGWWWWL